MNKYLMTLLAALLLAAGSASAQTTTPLETYVYGQGAASSPYGSGLRIPAVPSSAASALQYIPGNVLTTLTDTQTLTNKTLTSPTINGGALSGTFSGNPTYSGIPTFSSSPVFASILGSTQCLHVNSAGAVSGTGADCGAGGGGGGTSVLFVGTTAGGPTAYTMSSTVPTGFTATPYYEVCGTFATANTGAATLNVNSTGAIPINKQTDTGVSVLTGGEISGNNTQACFQLNSAASAWVKLTYTPGSVTVGQTSTTVTQAQWMSGKTMIFNSGGQTLTLPIATSLSSNGGGLVVQTVGVTVTLTPNAADGINGGGLGTSITIPADTTTVITTSGSSGSTAFDVPLGPVQYFPATWSPGMNLSTAALPIGRFATPRTIYAITCVPEVLVGGTATIDVYTAPSGLALGSGTKLNSASCNANSAATTEQSLGVASAQVPAGYWVGIVSTGAGWASSSGAGAVQVSFR